MMPQPTDKHPPPLKTNRGKKPKEKTYRVIVEITRSTPYSERQAVQDVQWALDDQYFSDQTADSHATHIAKGFSATLARERKKGKREKTRFQAGR